MPEKTIAEKLTSPGGFNFDLGDYAKLPALNRREVEMLLERYKHTDDVLAAEEHNQQGHFSQQEIQARRKRPGVQAIGLDMVDGENGHHVWTEAMKISYSEASRSKIPKLLDFRALDAIRSDFDNYVPRSYRPPEVKPNMTQEEYDDLCEKTKRDSMLTKFEVALLVNLQPTTAAEAKALIKPLLRYDDADMNEIINMLSQRMRKFENEPAELYSFEVFGSQVTDNHIGPILGGGASGLDGLNMSYRAGEAEASRKFSANGPDAGERRVNKTFDFDFGDKV
jgi:hypothetical protein